MKMIPAILMSVLLLACSRLPVEPDDRETVPLAGLQLYCWEDQIEAPWGDYAYVNCDNFDDASAVRYAREGDGWSCGGISGSGGSYGFGCGMRLDEPRDT